MIEIQVVTMLHIVRGLHLCFREALVVLDLWKKSVKGCGSYSFRKPEAVS
jgi:hypothetical protein